MNTSGDAAESIVRMSLQGLEVAVRQDLLICLNLVKNLKYLLLRKKI